MGTHLNTIGAAIRMRRTQLGLSQARLAQLSGLSRQTLSGLENGTLQDLGVNRVAQVLNVLGMDAPTPTTQARDRKRGLWMAAKTASVSYRQELAPDSLAQALVTGTPPAQYIPHLAQLLDEAPIPLLVMAVEEAARDGHVKPQKIWRNVAALAKELRLSRQDLLS